MYSLLDNMHIGKYMYACLSFQNLIIIMFQSLSLLNFLVILIWPDSQIINIYTFNTKSVSHIIANLSN